MATGFAVTTLIANGCYRANAFREDESLYRTMVAIRNRLNSDREVAHPTVQGEMLTSGPEDGRTKFLRERLSWAIEELGVLFKPNCTRYQALKAWDKVFDTTFFGDRVENRKREREWPGTSGAAAVGGGRGCSAVDRRGGGRYA